MFFFRSFRKMRPSQMAYVRLQDRPLAPPFGYVVERPKTRRAEPVGSFAAESDRAKTQHDPAPPREASPASQTRAKPDGSAGPLSERACRFHRHVAPSTPKRLGSGMDPQSPKPQEDRNSRSCARHGNG